MTTTDRQQVIALLRRAHARLTDALDAGAWDDETQELADLANDLAEAARAVKARRERNGLTAEIERLRELRDAAVTWRQWIARRLVDLMHAGPEENALIAAVDALDTAGTAPAASGEAGR